MSPENEKFDADDASENPNDLIWDKVQEIESELFDELHRMRDKYDLPISVVGELAVGMVKRINAMGYMYAEAEDKKREDFDQERN